MFKSVDTVIGLTKAGFQPVATAAKSRHFATIGDFIVTVGTEIDARLKSCLLQQIGSDEETLARAIVGDMRVGDVVGALRRIAESRSPSAQYLESLNKLFTEIANLRRERNVVAHQTCMVYRNKLAFHNASYARTDAAIEVNIHTVSDLKQMTLYARRLGYRILKVFSVLPRAKTIPAPNKAAVTLLLSTLLSHSVIALVRTKTLSKEKLSQLKAASDETHRATKAYVDVARHADPTLHNLQTKASEKIDNFLTAILLANAPDGPELFEIPARLKPPRGASRKKRSRGLTRTRKST
jgi:hypothetical protein